MLAVLGLPNLLVELEDLHVANHLVDGTESKL